MENEQQILEHLLDLKGEVKQRVKRDQKVDKVLFGSNGETIGLLERMRVQEKFTDNIRRLVWVMVPFLIISTMSLAWNIALSYLTISQ